MGCGQEDLASGPISVVAPVPTPTPGTIGIVVVPVSPSGPSQPAVERCGNGNLPVASFNIRLFAVTDAQNQLRTFVERTADDLMGPFYRGEALRFEANGWDPYGRPTDGCTGDGPVWHANPPELLEWNSPHGWMPSARVAGRGIVIVTAEFEGGALAYRLRLSLD